MTDTTYTSHCDTLVEGKHVIIDTTICNDTLVIEKTTYDKEIQIIEKLINRPDFGKSFASVLVVVFVIYTIWKNRKKN